MESAGARVVPILATGSKEYFTEMFQWTNGLLLPGGDVSIEHSGSLDIVLDFLRSLILIIV